MSGKSDFAGYGGCVDYATVAVVDHLLCEGLCNAEGAIEIDVEGLVPFFLRHLKEFLIFPNACIINEDIDLAEVLEYGGSGVVDALC